MGCFYINGETMPNEPQVIDVADALSHDDCDSILGKQYLSKTSKRVFNHPSLWVGLLCLSDGNIRILNLVRI